MKNSNFIFKLSCIIPSLLISCVINLTAQNDLIGYTYMLTLDGHHYYISDCEATWEEANEAATEMGGYLATISYYEEHFYLVDWIYTIDGGGSPGAWIGFHGEHGVYDWVGENGCCNDFICSDDVYPDPAGFAIGDDNALLYSSSVSGCWISYPISIETRYIVEFPFQPSCNNNPDKAYVCHNGNTICVNTSALQSHLDHGDLEGPCGPCNSYSLQVLPDEILVTEDPTHQPAKVTHSESKEELEVFHGISSSNHIHIFPNPASEKINVVLPDANQDGTLRILSLTGQEIHVLHLQGQQSITLDLSTYTAGIYLIDVRSANGHCQKKIVKL